MPFAMVLQEIEARADLLWWQEIARLLAAAFCGGVVGWEREVRARPAGLRTHILVATGACMMTLVALRLLATFGGATDPARIIEGIVGGIGFLGAGAIIQARGRVRGLTTAAGLWVVAALGIAAGIGSVPIAATGVILTLVTLTVLRVLEGPGSPTDGSGTGDAERD